MSRLLEQVREAIRTRHYSIRTEEAYLRWIRQFILYSPVHTFLRQTRPVGARRKGGQRLSARSSD
jgi:Phage integrase, N-terminal SAM-like domain